MRPCPYSYFSPLSIRALLFVALLASAWLPARAAVHTGVWSDAPAHADHAADDAGAGHSFLQPMLASCGATDSCADAASYLFQSGYLNALLPDADGATLQDEEQQRQERRSAKGWLTSMLEGLGGMMEPGTAAIAVLGLLTFGISSMAMQGRNPLPKKRKYRAHR